MGRHDGPIFHPWDVVKADCVPSDDVTVGDIPSLIGPRLDRVIAFALDGVLTTGVQLVGIVGGNP